MKTKFSLLASSAFAAGSTITDPNASVLDLRAAGRRNRMWALGAMAVLCASPVYADPADTFPTPHPADVKIEDENNIDLLTGSAHFAIPDASVGDLTHVKTVWAYDRSTQPELSANPPPEVDNYIGGLTYEDARDYSTFDPSAWMPKPYFQIRVAGLGGNIYINQDHSLLSHDGNTLTGNGVTTWIPAGSTRDHPQVAEQSNPNLGTWTFTAKDGTRVDIDTNSRPTVGFSHYLGIATKITSPSGLIVQMNYRPDCIATAPRLQSVTRNDGLMLKYTYADSTCAAMLTGVIAINLAYEYCDPLADTCSVDPKWRRSQYSYTTVGGKGGYNVIDQTGALSRFNEDKWGRVQSYKPPHGTDETAYTYCLSYITSTSSAGTTGTQQPTFSGPNAPDPDESFCGELVAPGVGGTPPTWSYIRNRILTAAHSNQTWSYSLPTLLAPNDSPYFRQYTINRPIQLPTHVNIDTRPGGGMINFINPALADVEYLDPESQYIHTAQTRGQPLRTFTYDDRGNVLSDGITSADYEHPTCTNIVKCNKPNWVKDAAGNQSSFKYDDVHGGVLTETRPADPTGVTPQKRYTYVQRYAWYLNASGVLTRAASPIWKLASVSYCRTTNPATSGTGCAVAGDEVVTTYDYGLDPDGPTHPSPIPNNLWLRGQVVTAGGQSLRTCYGYDKYGNKISETSPRAGLAVCQ
jgi:hypothetical protein